MSATPPAQPERPAALPDRAADPAVLALWLVQVDAALAARPQDASLAWRRAELLRGLGRLQAAAAAYAALGSPAGTAMADLLRSESTEAAQAAGPARFVRLEGLLGPARRDELWGHVATAHARFTASLVGDGETERVDPAWRHSALLEDVSALRPWFLDLLQDVVAAERVLQRLGLAEFATGRRELQLTRHLDGGFFRPHRDGGSGTGPTASRRLTYVYYMHREPRRFTGGDLLLYDQGPGGRRTAERGFTRLEPIDDSLVFFASDRLHAVTPVALGSTDPLDGRWTVNGWLHDAEGPAEPE